MNIAKASERDINMAIDLGGILESIEKGFMPVAAIADDEEDTEFDRDNPDDCQSVLNLIIDKMRTGSIGRVIWGMAALVNPESKLLDPDADILKPHPSLIRIDDIKDQRTQRQSAILEWANATFGEATASNTGERIRRFAEESIELIQATGLDKQAIHNIIDHVYAKRVGNVALEIGQVGVSLLALAEHLGISAEEEERKEFQRISSLPSEHWQARQNAKADKGLALPSTAKEPSN
jgi:NTP pyrophosphatase (non-canonical NTP hydrolase)